MTRKGEELLSGTRDTCAEQTVAANKRATRARERRESLRQLAADEASERRGLARMSGDY